MILADTNVVIPLLIEHPHRETALSLFALDSDWHFPDWWMIEMSNVLRNYHRAGNFNAEEVFEIMNRAAKLFPNENIHPVDHCESLRIACENNISTYDACFIALARLFGQKLVTEDKRLRLACPSDTLSLEEALALFP